MFNFFLRNTLRFYNLIFINFIVLRSILKSYFINKKFYFIQVGANDGKSGDPIFFIVNLLRISGVLVEPVPYVFKKLKINYKDNKKVFLENSAISPENSNLDFYFLKESNDASIPGWYDQLGSFNLDVIKKHKNDIKNFDELLTSVKIPTTNFLKILNKFNIPYFDLIFIDTEGYDFEIVKTIPFDKFLPSIIIFEHKHLNEKDFKSSVDLLSSKGYKMFKTIDDFMFYL